MSLIPQNTNLILVDTRIIRKTFILPSVSSNPGRILVIKDYYGTAAQSTITLVAQGTDLIDDYNTSYTFTNNYGTITFISDGLASWRMIGFYSGALSFASANNALSLVPTTGSSSINFLSPAGIQFTITFGQNTTKCNYYITVATTLQDAIPIASGVTSASGILQTITKTFIQGSTYYVIAVPFDSAGIAGPQFISPGAICLNVPSIPTNLSLSTNVSNVLTLSWSASLNALSYIWTLYQGTTNDYTTGSVVATNTSSSTSATFQTSSSGYFYFTVLSTNLGGNSQIAVSSILQVSVTVSGVTTFATSGSYQVSTGITSLYVYLWGAGGGGGDGGGAGACVQGVLAVTPSETLNIVVGIGGGINYNSFYSPNCGGGGGKTSIQRGTTDVVVAGAGGGGGSYPGGGYGGRAAYTNQSYSGGFTYASQVLGQTRSDIASLGGDNHHGGGANTTLGNGMEGVDYGLGGGGGDGYTIGGRGGIGGYAGGGGSSFTSNISLIPGQSTLGFTSSNNTAPGNNIIGYQSGCGVGSVGIGSGGNGFVILSTSAVGYSVSSSLSLVIAGGIASLSWGSTSGASSYIWTLYQNTTSLFTGIVYKSGSTTSLLASTSVQSGYYYYFTIQANVSGSLIFNKTSSSVLA